MTFLGFQMIPLFIHRKIKPQISIDSNKGQKVQLVGNKDITKTLLQKQKESRTFTAIFTQLFKLRY